MILLSTSLWTDPYFLVSIISIVVAVVIGITGIIISYLVYKRTPSLPRKEITYQVIEDLSTEQNDENHLRLKIWNSGKTEVKIRNALEVNKKALVEPFTFMFAGATVEKVEIVDTAPKEDVVLRAENRKAYLTNPSPQPDSIGLPSCLLQPRQSMTLSILLKGHLKGEVTPRGSLDGVKLISFKANQQKKDQIRQRAFFSFATVTICLLVFVIFLGALNIFQSTHTSSSAGIVPSTTAPSSLFVTASIAEDQNAVAFGSEISLSFSTTESIPPRYVIFTHGETVICNGILVKLGNEAYYSFRVVIPYNFRYTCDYHYLLNGKKKTATIFTFHAAQYPLSPVLQTPTNGNIQVHYTPGTAITNASNCTVQVTANAPNQSVSGDPVPQKGNMYTGPDASSLNGLGNIVITRTCTPINYNSTAASSTTFASINVTYSSTASESVSW